MLRSSLKAHTITYLKPPEDSKGHAGAGDYWFLWALEWPAEASGSY